MIRVALPQHLRTLARVDGEVELSVGEPATLNGVLAALEEGYPMLCGTIRDHNSTKRRDFIRFFACGEDITFEPVDDPLPERVAAGEEPLRVVAAMAGG